MTTDSPNWVSVTSDGGVKKLVTREGTGEEPPLHARCLVHLVGRLPDEGGQVFLDTRAEGGDGAPSVMVAGRVAAARDKGVTLAVAKMRRGELCRLAVAPEYGYGAEGSFSFPAVPPNARLEYELELLDFEPPEEGKERSLMFFEERLEAAERGRRRGNAAYAAGDWTEALGKYSMALSYMDDEFMFQLEGAHLASAHDVRSPVHLNMAACQVKLQDWRAVVYNCSQVLAQDRGCEKAWFRRGVAQRHLGRPEDALADLREAARLGRPPSPAVQREIQACQAEQREARQAEARLFRGAFQAPAAGARGAPGQGEGWRSRALAVWAWLLSWLRLLLGLQRRKAAVT